MGGDYRTRRDGHRRHKEHDKHRSRSALEGSSKPSRLQLQAARQRPQEATAPVLDNKPLSNDRAYVQQWLAHTEAENLEATEVHDDSHHSRGAQDIRRRINNHKDSTAPRVRNDVGNRGFSTALQHNSNADENRKRKRHDSTDSSIIDYPTGKESHSNRKDSFVSNMHHSMAQDQYTPQQIPSSVDEFPDFEEPQSKSRKETFEKRARHKTREDRYESKPASKSRHKKTDDPDSITTARKKTRKVQKKLPKNSSARLMQDFASDKLARDQERLTLAPGHGPGIFRNGRASMPAQLKGVPDLAFSEMEFLRHRRRPQPSIESSQAGNILDDRLRERSRSIQNDALGYFETAAASLQDYIYNATGIRPQAGQRSRLGQIMLPAQEASGTLQYRVGPIVPTREQVMPSDGHSHRSYMRPRISNTNEPSRARSTSYVSWSESQYSKQIAPPGVGNGGRHNAATRSSTPETVRRIIEETGVFRYDGKNEARQTSKANLVDSQALPIAKTSQKHRDFPRTRDFEDRMASETPPKRHGQHAERMPDAANQSLQRKLPDTAQTSMNTKQKPSLTRVQIWEAGRGWVNQQPGSGEMEQSSLFPELDRAGIAQTARLRAPQEDAKAPEFKQRQDHLVVGRTSRIIRDADIQNQSGLLAQAQEDQPRAADSGESESRGNLPNCTDTSDRSSSILSDIASTSSHNATENINNGVQRQERERPGSAPRIESAGYNAVNAPRGSQEDTLLGLPVRGGGQANPAVQNSDHYTSYPVTTSLQSASQGISRYLHYQPMRSSHLNNVMNADELGSPASTEYLANIDEELMNVQYGLDNDLPNLDFNVQEELVYDEVEPDYGYDAAEQYFHDDQNHQSETQHTTNMNIYNNTYHEQQTQSAPSTFRKFNMWEPFRQY